ncbi:MAG: hypothetical protein LBI44_07985 [Oscillospiraceae bacterium]|nr:hypothetical protein [Oscillospiraceae bacterium]
MSEDGEARALAAITALEPEVTSFESLSRLPESEDFNRRVLGGDTLEDAFKLTYFDKLLRRGANEAHARARREAALAHFSPLPEPGGGAGQSMPEDVLESYRLLCPGCSDEEYRAHYRKNRGAG